MHRILIVDDECIVADTVAMIFRKHGFEVRTAYSADDGLICARDFQPDLLVCDFNMPDRNGLELMRDIARELPTCKIIVLTAQQSHRHAVAEQSRQMPHPASFLIKPCSPHALLREAGAVLARA